MFGWGMEEETDMQGNTSNTTLIKIRNSSGISGEDTIGNYFNLRDHHCFSFGPVPHTFVSIINNKHKESKLSEQACK